MAKKPMPQKSTAKRSKPESKRGVVRRGGAYIVGEAGRAETVTPLQHPKKVDAPEPKAKEPKGPDVVAIGAQVLALIQNEGGDSTVDQARIAAAPGQLPELAGKVLAILEHNPSLSPAKAWDIVRAETFGTPREF